MSNPIYVGVPDVMRLGGPSPSNTMHSFDLNVENYFDTPDQYYASGNRLTPVKAGEKCAHRLFLPHHVQNKGAGPAGPAIIP